MKKLFDGNKSGQVSLKDRWLTRNVVSKKAKKKKKRKISPFYSIAFKEWISKPEHRIGCLNTVSKRRGDPMIYKVESFVYELCKTVAEFRKRGVKVQRSSLGLLLFFLFF